MALQDFIQALQEQDVVYSTPPQPSIRVIPPENQCIKVIPPENTVEVDETPKVIKLKLKPKQSVQHNQTQTIHTQNSQTIEQQPVKQILKKPDNKPSDTNKIPRTPTIDKPINPEIKKYTLKPEPAQQTIQQPTKVNRVEPKQPVIQKDLTEEELFNNTGTEYSKKEIWIDYYMKAKNSRKSNPIVDRMKIGRFTITPDNKVLLLPDYDIVGKDPDDVLKDKWF